MESLWSFFTSLGSFLVVIGVVIFVHELGHYVTARLLGVQVHEFSLGFGPLLAQKKSTHKSGKFHTKWSLRAVPFGGFCRLAGMSEEKDEEEEETIVPGMGFNEQPAWKRFFVLLNGSLCNILLAFILMTMLLSGRGYPDMLNTKIGALMDDFPAQQAGFQVGDRILEVNGTRVSEWDELRNKLREAAAVGDVTFTVERGDLTLTITTAIPFNEAHGVYMLGINPTLVHSSVLDGMRGTARYFREITAMTLRGIGNLIIKPQEADVAGPLGIASFSGKAARDGVWSFVSFMVLINLSLGLLNLFPIPALDGGHILFLFLEVIFRRRIPEKFRVWVTTAGFALLMCLMAFATFKDIYNLFFVE